VGLLQNLEFIKPDCSGYRHCAEGLKAYERKAGITLNFGNCFALQKKGCLLL